MCAPRKALATAHAESTLVFQVPSKKHVDGSSRLLPSIFVQRSYFFAANTLLPIVNNIPELCVVCTLAMANGGKKKGESETTTTMLRGSRGARGAMQT